MGNKPVPFEEYILLLSGRNNNGWPVKSTEWFDGTSWSSRAFHDWRIGVSCFALDAEADLFYLVGGFCPK